MRVLIVGEASNLARAIKQYLDDRGTVDQWVNSHDVRGLDPRSYRYMSHDSDIPEFDAASEIAVHVMEEARPDLIINAAGLVGGAICYNRETLALSSNYMTAKNVASVARLTGCKVVHLATSASYSNQHQLISEDTPPSYYQTSYGLTKLLGEQAIAALPEEQYLIARVVFVYGSRWDRSSVISTLIRHHVQGRTEKWNQNLDLDLVKGPLYITDFAEAVGTLIDQEATGTYMVGHPLFSVPYREVLRQLGRQGVGHGHVVWESWRDSLGNHRADVSKLLMTTGLGRDGWPRVLLADGIRQMISEIKGSCDVSA